MCGRFSLTAEPDQVAELLGDIEIGDFPPRYNIAPTQPILVVGINAAGKRAATLARWGLMPAWVKDPGDFTLLINARSETAAQKASFKTAMRHRRVLIPASGFYEWHRPADKKLPKQAYWIHPANDPLITFGGLMETWIGADGSEIDTACILTTQSNDQIGNIHHRMPVVIQPEDYDRWLDCKTREPRDVADLLGPVEDGFFVARPVSDRVNKVKNAGPDIQEEGRAEPVAATRKRSAAPGASDGQLDLF